MKLEIVLTVSAIAGSNVESRTPRFRGPGSSKAEFTLEVRA
jgi:hypothetical protein